jgi:hypothetical protein
MQTDAGKQSVTGGSLDAGEQDASKAQGAPGKQSLVEKELGGPKGSGSKRKADDDHGDSGGGSGHGGGDDRGGKRATGTGGLTEFPYKINVETLGKLTDATAVVKNALQPLPAKMPKDKGPGYVGSIITTASGKDKTPLAVAKQYEAEAFDKPKDARDRFALVVGVNRMQSVVDADGGLGDLKTQSTTGVTSFQGFPLAAFMRLWEPQWVNKTTNAPVETAIVRSAARNHEADARAAEAVRPRPPAPVGPMRTETAAHPDTTGYLGKMEQHFENVYLHVGDSDAVNLKAKATNEPGEQARGLFDRYDDVLGQHQQAHGGNSPLLATGGYRFRVDNDYTEYHGGATHADPHAGDAGKVAPMTAESAALDMDVRQTMAKTNPNVPYMPEPNLLVHSSVAQHADFGKTNTGESRALVKSIAANAPEPQAKGKPPPEWARDNMVFDNRAALYTDGKRFNKAMIGEDEDKTTGYGAGATDVKGLTNKELNPQSIVPPRPQGNAVGNAMFTSAKMDARVHEMRAALTLRVVGANTKDDDDGDDAASDAASDVASEHEDVAMTEVFGPVQDAPAESLEQLDRMFKDVIAVLNQALTDTLTPREGDPRYKVATSTDKRDKKAKKKQDAHLKDNAGRQTDDVVEIPPADQGDVARIEQALQPIAFPNALAQTRRAFAERLNIARRAGAGLVQRDQKDILDANKPKASKSKKKAPAVSAEAKQAAQTKARARVDDMITMLAAVQVTINKFMLNFQAHPEDQGVIAREQARRAAADNPPPATQTGAVTDGVGQLRIDSPPPHGGDVEMS